MAFDKNYLVKIAGQGTSGIQLWSYKTQDAAATVDTSGYFSAGLGIRKGDIIFRTTVTNLGASNEAVSTAGMHVILTASSSTVDATDTTALTVTNTD